MSDSDRVSVQEWSGAIVPTIYPPGHQTRLNIYHKLPVTNISMFHTDDWALPDADGWSGAPRFAQHEELGVLTTQMFTSLHACIQDFKL